MKTGFRTIGAMALSLIILYLIRIIILNFSSVGSDSLGVLYLSEAIFLLIYPIYMVIKSIVKAKQSSNPYISSMIYRKISTLLILLITMIGFIMLGSQHIYNLSVAFLFLGIVAMIANIVIMNIKQKKEDRVIADKLRRGDLSIRQGKEINKIRIKIETILSVLTFVVFLVKIILRK